MNRLQKISLSMDMKITGNHFIKKKKISERPMITKNVKKKKKTSIASHLPKYPCKQLV